MRIKEIKFMQQGGPAPMPTEGASAGPEMSAPVEGGAPVQGGAKEQLAQLAGQLVEMLLQQLQDPNAVMAVLEAAMQMLQESIGGGQPVFKKGGKLAKKCGGKMAKKK